MIDAFDMLRLYGCHCTVEPNPGWMLPEYRGILKVYDARANEHLLVPVRDDKDFDSAISVLLTIYAEQDGTVGVNLLLGATFG